MKQKSFTKLSCKVLFNFFSLFSFVFFDFCYFAEIQLIRIGNVCIWFAFIVRINKMINFYTPDSLDEARVSYSIGQFTGFFVYVVDFLSKLNCLICMDSINSKVRLICCF
jgi:hypothetical protein